MKRTDIAYLTLTDKRLIGVLKNPYGYSEDAMRQIRLAAALRIESYREAYENMRSFAQENGLDTTAVYHPED